MMSTKTNLFYALVLALPFVAAHADDDDEAPHGDVKAVAFVKTVATRQAPANDELRAYGTVGFAGHALSTVSLPYMAHVLHLAVGAGQAVRKGETLIELEPDPSAVLAYREALSAVSLAQGELRRTESLFGQALATTSQVETAKKTLSDAEQNLAAQRQLGAIDGVQRVTAPEDGIVVSLAVAQGIARRPVQPCCNWGGPTPRVRA